MSGKYTQVEIDYGNDSAPKKTAPKSKSADKKPVASSNLDERVQNLIKLIFDMKMMEVGTEIAFKIFVCKLLIFF